MKINTQDNWSLAYRAVYAPAWLAIGVALKILSPRFKVTGRGNLPRRGSIIFAPNHVSDIDPVLVGFSALRPLSFMAKKPLFDIAVLGPMMRFANAFPVEQGSPDRAALRQAEAQLKMGHRFSGFPRRTMFRRR